MKSSAGRKTATEDLQTIPGVGPSLAEDLRDLGFDNVADLRGRDPERMYRKLVELRDGPIDRCVLYVFRCAVYYASHSRHEPNLLKWWNWKDAKLSGAREGL